MANYLRVGSDRCECVAQLMGDHPQKLLQLALRLFSGRASGFLAHAPEMLFLGMVRPRELAEHPV